jgi:hypothetical protein
VVRRYGLLRTPLYLVACLVVAYVLFPSRRGAFPSQRACAMSDISVFRFGRGRCPDARFISACRWGVLNSLIFGAFLFHCPRLGKLLEHSCHTASALNLSVASVVARFLGTRYERGSFPSESFSLPFAAGFR